MVAAEECSAKDSLQNPLSSGVHGCCKMEEYELESTYALEQLQIVAHSGFALFMVFMKECFGCHYGEAEIRPIYEKALAKDLSLNPKIKVLKKTIKSHEAAYLHAEQTILVYDRFVCEALHDNSRSAELLAALAEEFGHHLEELLSQSYSQAGRDSLGDVGAKFSFKIVTINRLESKKQYYGKVNGKELVWQYKSSNKALQKHVDKQRQAKEEEDPAYSFFKDTKGHGEEAHGFGHHEIEEKALVPIFLNLFDLDEEENENVKLAKEIVSRIYLGNWMRDYSQGVDPMTIRPLSNVDVAFSSAKFVAFGVEFAQIDWGSNELAKEVAKFLKTAPDYIHEQDKNGSHYTTDTPPHELAIEHAVGLDVWNLTPYENVRYEPDLPYREDPDKEWGKIIHPPGPWGKIFSENAKYTVELQPILWSREFMTSLITLAAAQTFVKPMLSDLNKDNFENFFENFAKRYIAITPELLGCYRPDEHIDNPGVIRSEEERKSKNENLKLNTPEENANNTGFVGAPYEGSLKKGDGELHIDTFYGMKNYIRTGADSTKFSTKRTAYELLEKKLKEAATAPNFDFDDPKKCNMKAMVDFGAALHIVEDFFGHTNYPEIALMKLGYDRVYPWVDRVETHRSTVFDYDLYARKSPYEAEKYLKLFEPVVKLLPNQTIPKGGEVAQHIPLVTGTFATLEVIPSLLPKIYGYLTEINNIGKVEFESGKRGVGDVIMLQLAKEMDSTLKQYHELVATATKYGMGKALPKIPSFEQTFKAYLAERDVFYDEINHDVRTHISPENEERFYARLSEMKAKLNFGLYMLVLGVINTMNEAQQLFAAQIHGMEQGDKVFSFMIGTNPTHTQIAKDDPSKPTHDLAAKLAIRAVQMVGEDMFDIWKKNKSLPELMRRVDKLMRHPAESTWQDDLVKKWAEENYDKVCQSMTPVVVIDSLVAGIREFDEFLETLLKMATEIEGSFGKYMVEGYSVQDSLVLMANGISKDIKELKAFLNESIVNRDKELTVGTSLSKKLEKYRSMKGGDIVDKALQKIAIYLKEKNPSRTLRENLKDKLKDLDAELKKELKNVKKPPTQKDVSMVGCLMQEYDPDSSLYARITILKYNGNFLVNRAKSLYSKYRGVYYKPDSCSQESNVYIIYFDTAKTELRVTDKSGKPDGKTVLKAMMMSLNRRGVEFTLKINGHADERGTDEFNDPLSLGRAKTVEKYFRDNGWKNVEMKIEAFGETQLIEGASHQENRRVEIIVENKRLESPR